MSSGKVRHDGAKCRKKENVLVRSTPCNSRSEMAAETSSKTSTPSSFPSTSLKVLSLETASVGFSSKAGPRFLETTGLSSGSKETEQKKRQSKHCEENVIPIQIYRQRRRIALAAEVSSKAENIEPDGNVEEVVDLTCDSTIVDLTHNESVVFVEETQCQHHELRTQPLSDSCTLYSDCEAQYRESDPPVASRLSSHLGTKTVGSSRSSGTVSCPICMDSYAEIVHNGRLIVSTKCGHIFCSYCLCNHLTIVNSCPTCRNKLGRNQYHPIYI